MKKAIFAAMLALSLVCTTGCRESNRVSYNVSKEADSFNVTRRITVFNLRSDKVLWQMTGNFSTEYDGRDLNVLVELPDGTYAKHFFEIESDWTTYIIEDLSGTDVTPYAYELNFLPESLPGVTITSND